MLKGRLRRTLDAASWVLIGGLALVAIVAWTPSLRFAFGAPTEAAKRGASNDFTLTQLDGRPWTLSAQRGKVVLVNFWATWCPPCRMETPELVALKTAYASRPFEVVGISMDEDKDTVPGFVKRYNINYPILLPNGPVSFGGDVSALPTSFLVDQQGRIAREYVGMISERAVRGDIDRLLAERESH